MTYECEISRLTISLCVGKQTNPQNESWRTEAMSPQLKQRVANEFLITKFMDSWCKSPFYSFNFLSTKNGLRKPLQGRRLTTVTIKQLIKNKGLKFRTYKIWFPLSIFFLHFLIEFQPKGAIFFNKVMIDLSHYLTRIEKIVRSFEKYLVGKINPILFICNLVVSKNFLLFERRKKIYFESCWKNFVKVFIFSANNNTSGFEACVCLISSFQDSNKKDTDILCVWKFFQIDWPICRTNNFFLVYLSYGIIRMQTRHDVGISCGNSVPESSWQNIN